MSDIAVSHQEKEDQRRGAITSGVIHLFLLILVLFPFLHPPDPPPGQAGVLIAFGEPDAGESGGDIATAPPITDDAEPVEADEPEEPVKEEKPKKEVPKPKEKPAPVKQPKKEVQTDKNSKERAIAAEKAKAKEAAEKKLEDARNAAEAEAKAKQDKIAKAKRVADAKAAEAKRVADAKAAEAEKYRNLGRTAGSNTGGGSGNKPGNQGQPDGDPGGEALDGISTGSGVLGGGIAGRKIVRKPRIEDRSQNTGTVNVKVCVDADGNVTSAKYTLSGSTTSNANLIKKAVEGAKAYRFDETDRESQCGTIKINFRVQ